MLRRCRQFFLLVLFLFYNFKLTTATSLQKKLDTYEDFVNMSLLLEKEDISRINSWSEEVQVKMIDVTTKYRLEMTKHQQHSFRRRPQKEKWTNCLKVYQNETNKHEQWYYMREHECLKAASSFDGGTRQAVTQVGREIRKWRRTYKYLKNVCQTNNIGDEGKIGICLVGYMERDNYSSVFQRLISLRLELVQDLHNKMNISISSLEDCLKIQFSKYLEHVRKTMEVLNRCYGV